jgi:hypothetical protein
MAVDTESKIKQDLLEEIGKLEETYSILGWFIGGADFDVTEIAWNLQAFKDSLSRASAYVLALYNLKGRRVTIPWESLFTSLDYALATVSVAAGDKQKAAVKTILDMAKDQLYQVLSYFEALKDSLK